MQVNKDLKIDSMIPKEIDKLEEPIIRNLNTRMFFTLVLSLIIAGTTYYFLYDSSYVKIVIILEIVLTVFLGIFEYNGLRIGEFIKAVIKSSLAKELDVDDLYGEEFNDNILKKDSKYVVCYRLEEINYLLKDFHERENLMNKYISFINNIDEDIHIKVLIRNRKFTEEDLKLIKVMDSNNLKEYRSELNNIMEEKVIDSNIHKKDTYLMLSTKENDNVIDRFKIIDLNLKNNASQIRNSIEDGVKLKRLSNEEIKHVLSSCFGLEKKEKLKLTSNYLTNTKGEYIKSFIVSKWSNQISDTLLQEVSNTNIEYNLTIYPRTVKRADYTRLLEQQLTQLESRGYEYRKKESTKRGYLVEENSIELQEEIDHIKEIQNVINHHNQRVFKTSIVVTMRDADLKSLELKYKRIDNIFKNYQMKINNLKFQQGKGLIFHFPFINSNFALERFLITENVANFIPFKSKEFTEKGVYYGQNKVNNSIISLSRDSLKNQNGFIIGVSGSGKSFTAKLMMLQTYMNSDDDIIIIDPEREYKSITKALNGEEITISANSTQHINPMELTKEQIKQAGSYKTAVKEKSDDILHFINLIIDKDDDLRATSKTVIDKAMTKTYDKFRYKGKQPTLKDLGKSLEVLKEPEGKLIAKAIELYTSGSFDLFSKETNVNVKNKLICYDIYDVGNELKAIGIMTILNDIWKRVIENRDKGKRTHIFIDEIHLLFKNKITEDYLQMMYKRVRKFGGVPIGITQDVEDLLSSEGARGMLANSEFLIMLAQSEASAMILKKVLSLNTITSNYLHQGSKGHGIIKFGADFIPFNNSIKKENKIFTLLQTDAKK